MKIPFLKLTLGAEEKRAINEVIDSGWVVMGKKTQEFEEKFAEYVGAKYAVFVDSGTAALDLAIKYNIRFGEEIKKRLEEQKKRILAARDFNIWAVPSLTFTSSAEVLVHNGLIPYFSDVDKKDFCLSKSLAVTVGSPFASGMVVNLLGNRAFQSPWFVQKIIDSAHRIVAQDVLDSDAMWCYSFYATKNITTIQGGMIATNNKDQAEWFKKARDHGISQGTKERYDEGKWEYSVDFVGWRVKADDIRAAIGIEQLKKIARINEERQRVIEHYNRRLGLERTGNHIYPVLVDKRPDFVNFMRDRGIQTSVHFLPLHKMPAYKKYPCGNLINTEYLGERLVSLPLFPTLKNDEIDEVCKAVEESNLLIHE